MSKKRDLVMVPLTNAQQDALWALFQAVRDANTAGTDAAILAQVYPDGIVATVVSEQEMYGVQEVLKPRDPWPGCSTAAERMAKAANVPPVPTGMHGADLSHL